jgi:hypothetical protein
MKFFLLLLLPIQTVWANHANSSVKVMKGWLDLSGIYFNSSYFDDLVRRHENVSSAPILGYLDTLMTLEIEKAKSPTYYCGEVYTLSKMYSISIVGVEHQYSSTDASSKSIWAVISDSSKRVVDSECLYSKGMNRVFKVGLCSILLDRGRMVIQKSDNNSQCSLRYINWDNLSHDGTPEFFFLCYDGERPLSSGDVMGNKKRYRLPFNGLLDSLECINLIKTDYVQTGRPCKQIQSKEFQANSRFLLHSFSGDSLTNNIVLIDFLRTEDSSGGYRLSIVKGNLFDLTNAQQVWESAVFRSEEIKKMSYNLRRKGAHWCVKIRVKGNIKPRFVQRFLTYDLYNLPDKSI